VQLASFVQATGDLEALAEVKVSRERVQRWTKRIGNQRVAQIKEQAEAYQELSLPDRGRSPVDQVPQVACVVTRPIGICISKAARQASISGGWQISCWRARFVIRIAVLDAGCWMRATN
jgi:hypothetical protein